MRQVGSFNWRLAVLAAVASLLASACSGSAPPPSKPVVAPTTAPAPAPAAAAAPAGGAPQQAAKAESAPAPVLNVGLPANLQYAPWFVGVEKGIFLKNGVDVKIRQLNTGTEVVKAVQANEVETGVAAFTTLIGVLDQDIKFKAFVLVVSDATVASPDDQMAIIATPESGILKVEDLRGKKVGVALGNTPDAYLKYALQRANVPIDAVEYVNVPPPNTLPSYSSGLDAVASTEPYGELILSKHPNAKLIVRGGGFVAQRIVLYANEDWLVANRPLAEKVVAGLVEASFIARTQRDVVAEVVPRWLSGIDSAVAAKAVAHIPFDPRLSPLVQQSWEEDNKILIDQKKLKQTIPFSRAMDVSLSEDIPRKYPQFLTDLKPVP